MQQCLALFSFFFIPLFGAKVNTESVALEGQNYNFVSEFINMLLTLGFVLVLIIVSVWFLKKIMRSRMHHLNRTTGIKILEKRPLNQKASLYLVDILGKGVVISESPAGIHLVTELPESMKVEEQIEQMQQETKPRASFKEIFADKLKKAKPSDNMLK